MQELRALAATLYPGHGFGDVLQRLRPSICPFDELLPFVPPSSTVLDVGCGSGLFLGLLALDGRLGHGTGIDLSARAIERARRMTARLPEAMSRSVELVVGGLADLPRDTFDVVTMVDVMHHIPVAERRDAFLLAAKRVRKGGLFLYKDLHPGPWWRATANRMHDLALAHEWVKYVSADDIRSWISESGLVAEVELELPRLWYAHAGFVLRRAG